jgi:hypothetical protein
MGDLHGTCESIFGGTVDQVQRLFVIGIVKHEHLQKKKKKTCQSTWIEIYGWRTNGDNWPEDFFDESNHFGVFA